MSDYEVIIGKVNEILSLLDGILPHNQIESLQVDVNAGEWALALEILCSNLYEYDIPIPARVYELINEAGKMMRMDESKWQMLQSQVSVTA